MIMCNLSNTIYQQIKQFYLTPSEPFGRTVHLFILFVDNLFSVRYIINLALFLKLQTRGQRCEIWGLERIFRT